MDDKYLDKVFRDKLEQPQDHGYNDAAWLDLESRLEDEPRRRIIPWRWIAAAGILLPMLLTSFYFYNELRQTEKQLAKLETKMNRLLQKETPKKHADATNQSLTMNDDIADNNGVLRQSPTIISESPVSETSNTKLNEKATFNTETYDQTTVNNTFLKESQKVETRPHTIIKNQHKESNISIAKETEQPIAFISPLEKAGNDEKANKAFYLDSKNEVAVKGFKYKPTTTTDIDYLNYITNNHVAIENKENIWSRATHFVTPIGYEVSVGMFGGTQVPTTTPLSTIRETEPYFNNKGIKGALLFENGVDLTLGVNIASYKQNTQSVGQDFPVVKPRNTGDVFQNIMVTDEVVQIPIGLKYNFGDFDAAFAPFVEIGGIAKRLVQKQYKFEYLSEKNSEPYAIYPTAQKQSGSFTMNTASISGGMRWNPALENRILDNIVIQTEAFVNADIETKNTNWIAGVGVSVNYMF